MKNATSPSLSAGFRRIVFPSSIVPLMMCFLLATHAHALIVGGKGNEPVRDPGWPEGAAAIFNHEGRVAWWEGPPFGGGQYHAECRGDADTLNEVLVTVSKLKAASRRLVVQDGVGHSFWLNPNNAEDQKRQSEIDWQLMVWVPENWQRLSKLPPDLNPTDKNDQGPPAVITVYAGGRIRWDRVQVPNGIQVIDNRMEARGYSAADGNVLEGTLADVESGAALTGRVELRQIGTNTNDNDEALVSVESVADAGGKWVIKNAPAGRFQVIAYAEGYVPQTVGYVSADDQPSYASFGCKLAKPFSVSGRIVDDQGRPLKAASVRLANFVVAEGQRYKPYGNYVVETNEQGKFELANVPMGDVTVHCSKDGYFRAGLGDAVSVPQRKPLELAMSLASHIEITVLFRSPNPPINYLVKMIPQGGPAVGKWSGSARINNQSQVVFRNVPPGEYVVVGHPNPTGADDKTPPIVVDLVGGQTHRITITAKQ